MWIRGLVIIIIIIIREVFAVWLATLCVQIQSMHARVVHNYFLVDSWWYCMFHSCCHVYCSIVLAVSVHHRRKICADWYWRNWRFEKYAVFLSTYRSTTATWCIMRARSFCFLQSNIPDTFFQHILFLVHIIHDHRRILSLTEYLEKSTYKSLILMYVLS